MDLFNKKKVAELTAKVEKLASATGTYNPLFIKSFDGEKNTGELGFVTKYVLDYASLRHRSWKSYLDDDITQTVIKRYVTWIIGGGLKLQAEPIDILLKSAQVTLPKDFAKIVEARFKVYSESRESDYCGINNIQRLAKTAYVNSIVGGDVLVVLRVVNGKLNIQLIDGSHIDTPMFGGEIKEAESRGNTIKNGIEEDKTGAHVAYYVKNSQGTYQRITVKGEQTGKEQAFLVYGLRYRINDNRGIPLVSTVLETLKKLDRYKEATVGSAEERAKIVYQIVHNDNSTGESPFSQRLAKAYNVDSEQKLPTTSNGEEIARTVAVSTQKQTFNMTQGSEMKALESKQELSFNDFYGTNANLICSTIGIPPEVAFSKYDSNFSASRAALKDWEHTINVERKEFAFQFYQKIYDYWLDLEIMQQKIQAPGYLTAVAKKDTTILSAFRNARFVGANVPHIDPLKEVKAEREKLGDLGVNIPLTTPEAATEALNGGDYYQNVEKFATDLVDLKNKKIIVEQETIVE